MTKSSLDDQTSPWTEDEFLALDETNHRIELLDGSLWVSPRPNAPHRDISGRLYAALLPGGDDAGVWVRLDVNVRLSAGTVMQPDLILSRGPRVVTVTDATDVLLACEITSPSNVTMDRVLKKELYASAKIKWYLLIEPEMTNYESVTLTLFRLEAGGYHTYAMAKGDETLMLDDPFHVAINANRLLGIRHDRD
ncbi:Uma2 family endonuclease [Actinoplanes sp. NPDC023801]|uniref:Uma2 family endonuclease n=1 Tax=Actinoplanes sp. NPDC023801 TaxID=3154595 RepID=UPI0033F6F43B